MNKENMENKKNMEKVIVVAQCKDIEAEMLLNQNIFDFNRLRKCSAIEGTSELKRGIPYVVEVLIEKEYVAAFVAYLNEFVPEANIPEEK